jgi:hypothetical protein
MCPNQATAVLCSRPARVAVAIAVLVFGILGAGATSASSAAKARNLPVVPVYLQAMAPDGLKIRPAFIIYTGDGSGYFGGRTRRGRIRWSTWSSRRAAGRGYDQIDDCTPDCARGHFAAYPVRIKLRRPRELGHHLVFTRLSIFYPNRHPGSGPRHFTLDDVYTDGAYYWNPPRT